MLLVLLLAIFPKAMMAQEATDSTVTVRGFVFDTAGGIPVVGMRVGIEGLDRNTLTDSAGTFILTAVPKGVHTVRGTRIGYALAVQRNVPIRDHAVLTLATHPQAIVLEGVSAEVNARIPPMIAQLEERRRRIGWQSVAFYQEDVWHSAAKNAYDFVLHRSRFRMGPCATGGYGCLYRRGRLVNPRVFVDEMQVSFESLARLAPQQIAAVELFQGGAMIRVYTNAYFGAHARTGRPLPLVDIIR